MGPSDIAYDYEQNRSNNSKPVSPKPVVQTDNTEYVEKCIRQLLRKAGGSYQSRPHMLRHFCVLFQKVRRTRFPTTEAILQHIYTDATKQDIVDVIKRMRGDLKNTIPQAKLEGDTENLFPRLMNRFT